MAPASPPWMEDGSSPMIAPTTLAGAAIFRAVNRNGSEAGTRSFHRTDHFDAAYELISSWARGSADRRPRSVLIVTGKNVRYAGMTATENRPAPTHTTTI